MVGKLVANPANAIPNAGNLLPQGQVTLGQRIAQARRILSVTKMMDVTRKSLAKLVGVAPSTIGRWEDDLRNPSEEEFGKLADVLGVSRAWLRYGEGEGPVVRIASEALTPEEMARYEAELQQILAEQDAATSGKKAGPRKRRVAGK